MGLFQNKYEQELDSILKRVDMNCSNNYKDAAQKDFREFCERFDAICAEGRLKEKSRKAYEAKRALYQGKMEGFTHKDQKPYWT